MHASRPPVSGLVLMAVTTLLLLTGVLFVLWWFIPPPFGLDESRARAVAVRVAPGARVTEAHLDHCDRLLRAYEPNVPPYCGGQWAWMLTLGTCGEGSFPNPSALLIDYHTGDVIHTDSCGLM